MHLSVLDGEYLYSLVLDGVDVSEGHPRPVHHAPSGIAWRYDGPGSADLALLILALHLPVTGALTREAVLRNAGYPSDPELEEAFEEQLERDGKLDAIWGRVEQELAGLPVETYCVMYVSKRSWAFHQAFKWSVLVLQVAESGHVFSAVAVCE